jgi:AcrR family transcriptional regulator
VIEMTELELGRRERKKEETRQRIVAAAVELFQRNGYEATTVDEIAARADVAKGTFFNYYPRKEAILDDVHEQQLEAVEAAADRALGNGGGWGEMMQKISREACEIYARDRDVSRVSILNILKNPPGSSPDAERTHQRVQGVVRRFIERGIAIGALRSDIDVERATYVMRGVFFFALLMWLCSAEAPYDLGDEIIARMNLVLEGIGARKDGAR